MVNCTRLQQVLDAHLDGELDPATAGEITTHLAGCAACSAMRDRRVALRETLRAHAPRFIAPPALAAALRRNLAQAGATAAAEATSQPRRAQGLSWFSAAAVVCVAALAGVIGGYYLALPQADDSLRDPAVASHVAALAPQRQLVEVASGDRHTVKPWFQGKVDFAPPVKDLAGEGFTLIGARLDQVGERPAAAVVYQIRKHVINLYAWRAAGSKPEAIATTSVRGFSVSTWAAGGLRFAAVSDVDGRDLTRFAQQVSAP